MPVVGDMGVCNRPGEKNDWKTVDFTKKRLIYKNVMDFANKMVYNANGYKKITDP